MSAKNWFAASATLALLTIGLVSWYGMIATAAVAASECNRWAQELGQQDSADSYVMHTIGCDDGPKANANYQRIDGDCSAAARYAYRKGLQPFTREFGMFVGATHSCVWDAGGDGYWFPE